MWRTPHGGSPFDSTERELYENLRGSNEARVIALAAQQAQKPILPALGLPDILTTRLSVLILELTRPAGTKLSPVSYEREEELKLDSQKKIEVLDMWDDATDEEFTGLRFPRPKFIKPVPI